MPKTLTPADSESFKRIVKDFSKAIKGGPRFNVLANFGTASAIDASNRV